MKSLRAGQLVTVIEDDGSSDAIISDTSHLPKVIVVVPDSEEEAVFKTVHIGKLRPRSEPGPHDHALRDLISRAAAEDRAGPPGSGGSVVQGRAGHSAPRPHRHAAR